MDRNLELLAQELALRGSRLFSRTTSAACASASVSHEDGNSHFTAANDVPLGEGEQIVIRERTARNGEEVRALHLRFSPRRLKVGLIDVEQGVGVQQYLAMWVAGATAKNGTSCRESDWKICSNTWQSFSLCGFGTRCGWEGGCRRLGLHCANAATVHSQSISWTRTSLMSPCW